MDLPISMTTNGAGDGDPIDGDRGVEALWAPMEENRQQMTEIHEMLVRLNLNANNRQPVDRTRAEGFARGQPVNRNEDCKFPKKTTNPSHSTLKDNISPPMSDNAIYANFQS